MKASINSISKPVAVFLILVCVLLAVPGAQAKIRTVGVDLPAYARIGRGEVWHTDQWAAIAFYRPVGCVPDDFNLLDFFDMGAFDCMPPTIDGFAIWSGEPYLTAPIQMHYRGLGAVPVWFVSWPEIEASLTDDILTIVELEGMQSLLIGSASFYTEALHPYDPTMVVRSPMVVYEAHGLLQDGRSFKVHVMAITPYLNAKWIENISIEFKP
jgi:hypothetical protein